MQHALIPVLMQQQHARLQLNHNLLLDRRVLKRQVVGVEDRLAALAACGGRGKVEQEGPGCFCGGGRGGGEVDDVRFVV